MGLTKTEVKSMAGDLFALADDLLKVKARKKPMTKAELKRFRNRALQIAVKLTIDIID
tara:strand:- start:7455 stop:7628 length:174 start_codon:yes stop_codon:yes gene_type:complete